MPATKQRGKGRKATKHVANVWGANQAADREDVTCPSGQTALVRRPGLEKLMADGLLNSMDTLTAYVDEKHVNKSDKDVVTIDAKEFARDMLKEPKKMGDVLEMVSKVVRYIVIEPHIEEVPLDDDGEEVPFEDREPGVYIDRVDLEDKMFLFSFAMGGTRDLETFRRESKQLVGSLEHEPGSSDTAE